LVGIPPGDRLLHGNLHLGNVVKDGSRLTAIDWADASAGDPHAEVAQTIVRYHVAGARTGDPRPASMVARAVRPSVRRAYLGAYQALATIDPARLTTWIGIRAVERLAENNDGERRVLERVARRCLPE
jgi:aminoglycoside phosphotransferase (APT) family kinase protein